MSRPPRPESHDETVRTRLEQSLLGEVVIPVTDTDTARLIRSRLHALIKSHRAWQTPLAAQLTRVRTKLLDTIRIRALRPELAIDPEEKPFCLVIDSRDPAAKALAEALTPTQNPEQSNPEQALTRPAPRPLIDPEAIPDDEYEDEFDYAKTMQRYREVF